MKVTESSRGEYTRVWLRSLWTMFKVIFKVLPHKETSQQVGWPYERLLSTRAVSLSSLFDHNIQCYFVIDQNNWEATALKRSAWRQIVQKGLFKYKEMLAQQHKEKRMRRKAAAHADRLVLDVICALCHRDCHSRIGLASHTRWYTRINT